MPAVYFVPYNFYSGKSPESMFCQRRVLNLRTAAGNLSLTDTALTERRDGEIFTKEAASREELAALIKTYFGIDFPAHLLRWEKR